jgi:hypothetical protein
MEIAPHFLPLQGESAAQTIDFLIRKGRLLSPVLTSKEAQGISRFMVFEHFVAGSSISFHAQHEETGRLMLILAGEAAVRMRTHSQASASGHSDYSPLGQVQAKWFSVGEGATLGLVHAFSGLSSRFVGQAVTDLFVASMPRLVLQRMKVQEPMLALRFLEITALELALVALDHEKSLIALTQVTRSMQEHIGEESGATKPAPLFPLGT